MIQLSLLQNAVHEHNLIHTKSRVKLFPHFFPNRLGFSPFGLNIYRFKSLREITVTYKHSKNSKCQEITGLKTLHFLLLLS